MIVEPLVPHYKTLLEQFLSAPDELAREAALVAVDELAQEMLSLRVSLDDMLALHSRAKARLADRWQACASDSPDGQKLQRLARGDDLPVMLALLLPEQVAERRQAERRWQAEHARLAAVFEQTDDLVLMFDSAGCIEYLNPAFIRATGHTLLLARTEPARVWDTALPKGGTTYVEVDLARADGLGIPTAWSVSAVTDADGQLLNHVCIGRDISEQRHYDDALRQNDRLRAVATLAAGIAHDFNNLLGSIQGLTEVCQAQVETGSRMERNLAGIHRASERAAELVTQMLGFAREQRSERNALDLGAWLESTRDLLAATLPRRVELRLQSDGPLSVQADAGQLEQVVLNLVKNAGYAMREHGGEVRVSTGEWRDEHGRCWARLQVIDQGEGMGPDVLPRIFDPFFTTKPVGEGTGLGLAAAYGIVRQHKGDLRVQSEPGQGSVFSLLLPLEGMEYPFAQNGAPSDARARPGADVASWYEVDGDDLLCAVSDDWDAFATDNDGHQSTADCVLGRPLASCMGGEATQHYMEALLGKARETAAEQVATYRCDSPSELRTMEMRLRPTPTGHVRVEHRVLSRQPRPQRARERLDEPDAQDDAMSRWWRCSECLRLRPKDGSEDWKRPRLGQALPRPVDDVVCELCATVAADRASGHRAEPGAGLS